MFYSLDTGLLDVFQFLNVNVCVARIGCSSF